ncbi:hypothetical protein [uncultured Friedmanniella sp.]|uniref:hypothetical protein n=1 Tax=uncultured Friedmanniella sp. TaxID=335381 RepID=UPI0035CB3156
MRYVVARGVATIAFGIALSGLLAPAATALGSVLIEDTSVTASRDEKGVITTDLTLVNLSGSDQTLVGEVTTSSGCTATVDDRILEPHQAGTVTLTFPASCFPSPPSALTLDLDGDGDGDGGLPVVTVQPPVQASDWAPLRWGVVGGVIAAFLVLVAGLVAWLLARHRLSTASDERTASYAQTRAIVDSRIAALGKPPLQWKPLPTASYRATSVVANLESGWSFKDSWISNLTLATTAFLALATSADAATALLGEEPKAAFRVMVVAGLLSAIVIALAGTVTKLLGPSSTSVTVLGLGLAAAMVCAAAVMQTVTIGLSAADLVASSSFRRTLAYVIMGAVMMVVVAFAIRSVWVWTVHGASDGVPAVPAQALTEWRATSSWQRALVDQRIRTAFGPWLEKPSRARAPMGPATHELPTGNSPGDGPPWSPSWGRSSALL